MHLNEQGPTTFIWLYPETHTQVYWTQEWNFFLEESKKAGAEKTLICISTILNIFLFNFIESLLFNLFLKTKGELTCIIANCIYLATTD